MSADRARRRRRETARQAARRRRDRRRRLGVAGLLAVLVLGGIGGLAVSASNRTEHRAASPAALPGLQTGPAPWATDTADLAERLRIIGLPPLNPTEGTAVHIHQHLDLVVDGRAVPVPAGIGIDPAVGFAPLHTHDASGVIHLESPVVRAYALGQFFAVWGLRFTPSCLGGYCAGGQRQLRIYVNGAAYHGDPTTLPLESHQELVIAFGTAAELPSPIPATYQFPPGE